VAIAGIALPIVFVFSSWVLYLSNVHFYPSKIVEYFFRVPVLLYFVIGLISGFWAIFFGIYGLIKREDKTVRLLFLGVIALFLFAFSLAAIPVCGC
jgi:hypothetical protein